MEQYNTTLSEMTSLFQSNNWIQLKNQPNHIIFQKEYQNYDVIELKVSPDRCFVTVPIKSGPCQYTTKFSNFSNAVDYIYMHLNNYENNSIPPLSI